MIFISHRGNIEKRDPFYENKPCYIEHATNCGYDAEVDVWRVKETLYTGHDGPQYKIDIDFLLTKGLWIHCKNIDAMEYLSDKGLNAFAHKDDIIITPNGYLWTAPGFPITNRSIAVMPELVPEWNIDNAIGICTDIISHYEYLLSDNDI